MWMIWGGVWLVWLEVKQSVSLLISVFSRHPLGKSPHKVSSPPSRSTSLLPFPIYLSDFRNVQSQTKNIIYSLTKYTTSCRRAAATICLSHAASWQYLRIYSPGGTSGMLAIFLRHQQQVDLFTLKLVSESRVTLASCANFSQFLGLCSQVRPDVSDRRPTKSA